MEDTNNTDIALKGVGRFSKPKVDLERKYAIALAKWAPSVRLPPNY